MVPVMSDLAQIVAKLAGDLGSPRVVDDIDRVLVHLLSLRNMAADLHGIALPPPVKLASAAAQEAEEPEERRKEPSGESSLPDMQSLVDVYLNDPRSPYRQLRHKTKENYNSLLRRILTDFSGVKLADLKRADFDRQYEGWKSGGKIAMAHSLVTMLRSAIAFGATVVEDPECLRLTVILHRMKFEPLKPRTGERLNQNYVLAIRNKAHEMGLSSIALAQAFQFDCRLGQKEVIGEWAPLSESGPPSGLTNGELKWLGGLQWNEIDQSFVLRHAALTQEGGAGIDLNQHPIVMEELRKYAGVKPHEPLPRSRLPSNRTPIIVYEHKGLPYLGHQFRRRWRQVATAAGVPATIENRDSRVSKGKRSSWQRAVDKNRELAR